MSTATSLVPSGNSPAYALIRVLGAKDTRETGDCLPLQALILHASQFRRGVSWEKGDSVGELLLNASHEISTTLKPGRHRAGGRRQHTMRLCHAFTPCFHTGTSTTHALPPLRFTQCFTLCLSLYVSFMRFITHTHIYIHTHTYVPYIYIGRFTQHATPSPVSSDIWRDHQIIVRCVCGSMLREGPKLSEDLFDLIPLHCAQSERAALS